MNAAYGTIANSGVYIKPKLYTRVLDYNGNVLLDNTQPDSRQVIKDTTAYLLTSAMMDVVGHGTGTAARFPDMAIAGKTGSTTGYNDVWFCGYTPYYTATVWAGYDNNIDMKAADERGLSRSLWKAVMEKVHEGLEYRDFPVPEDIVQATICSRSGKLPLPGICDQMGTLRGEIFADGTVPTDYCNAHYQGNVCRYSLLPANENCPFQVPGVLELLPPEDPALLAGSGTAALNTGEGYIQEEVVNEDGTVTINIIPQANIALCPHDWEFFMQPDAMQIIEMQKKEMEAAAAAQPPPEE
jgi:penicillin-binding protein 1A